MENMQGYIDQLTVLAVTYAPKLLMAILTLIIGLWVIKMVSRVMDKAMTRASIEVSLQKFLSSLLGIMLKALLVISVASMVGIATTSFVAVLGAAGLAVGFALQGSLSNFAGGVMLLLFKPFKVGDYIESQGHSGVVSEIQIFNTILTSLDNKRIIIPNGAVAGADIVNYTAEPIRRVDMTFGIGYNDNILQTREVLQSIIDGEDLILKDPAADILVSELADSSVNFAVRVWCKSDDYWDVYFIMHEKVKLTFDEKGISIPFPQQDVHMHQVATAG